MQLQKNNKDMCLQALCENSLFWEVNLQVNLN